VIGERRAKRAPAEQQIEFLGEDTSWAAEWAEFTAAIREERAPEASGLDGWSAASAAAGVRIVTHARRGASRFLEISFAKSSVAGRERETRKHTRSKEALMRNRRIYREYPAGVKEITEKIDRASLDHAVEMLWEAWQRGATVFTCGNGGSAGTATHLAADLFKCTIVPHQPRLRVLSLGDNVPLMSALVNDDGWENV